MFLMGELPIIDGEKEYDQRTRFTKVPAVEVLVKNVSETLCTVLEYNDTSFD